MYREDEDTEPLKDQVSLSAGTNGEIPGALWCWGVSLRIGDVSGTLSQISDLLAVLAVETPESSDGLRGLNTATEMCWHCL